MSGPTGRSGTPSAGGDSGVERSVQRLPPRTTAAYAAAASIWIVASDTVVALGVDGFGLGGYLINLSKGLVFVAVTSAVLYVVLRAWRVRLEQGLDDLELQRARFAHLVEATDDIFGVFDDDGRLTYVSPSLVKVLGWQVGDIIGSRGRPFVHPEDRDAAIDHLDRTRAGEGPLGPATFRLLAADGRWRHVEVVATDLRHEPSIGGVVVHGRDVTTRELAVSRLEHALGHDPVTGVPNRATYEDDLDEAALGLEFSDQHLAVVVLDLQAFREVNEQVGRARGDEVLRRFVERIGRSLDPLALGRLGADEFSAAIAVPVGVEAVPWCTEQCRRLLADVTRPYEVDGRRVDVSADIGGAVTGLPARIAAVLATAEANLAAAKQHPDQIVLDLHEPASRGRRGRVQPTELHEAIEKDQLLLHYQPQFEMATGRLVGTEALLRWQHPADGLLSPASFLDVATRGTLLPLVTRFVLAEATRQAATWERQGFDISVSVNLSLGDLRRWALADDVLAAIDASGLDPSRLRLELTEHTLFAERDRSLRTMHLLRRAGIGFSIDDFGTGYSSLAHLRTLPVDELKIDPVFVANMPLSEVDESIVSAIIDLGQKSGLIIVAEGIEDTAIWQALADRGCERGQGYLMGRPVPAGELVFEPFFAGAG